MNKELLVKSHADFATVGEQISHELAAKMVKDHHDTHSVDESNSYYIGKNIIDQMPPRQRLIYKLAKQEGWSREEIAKGLNISPNTVRNRLAAAIEFLRNYFRKNASIIIWTAIWMSF